MMYLGNQAVGIATSLPEFADIAKIECGNYTPESDTAITEVNILHSLGEVPDFIIYYTNDIVSGIYEYQYLICGSCFNVTLSSSFSGVRHCLHTQINSSQIGTNTTAKTPSAYSTEASFKLPYASETNYVKANTTYHYVIGKFKEVTPNA